MRLGSGCVEIADADAGRGVVADMGVEVEYTLDDAEWGTMKLIRGVGVVEVRDNPLRRCREDMEELRRRCERTLHAV